MSDVITIKGAALVGATIKEKGDTVIGEANIQFRTTGQNLNLFNELASRTGDGYTLNVEISTIQTSLDLDKKIDGDELRESAGKKKTIKRKTVLKG